MLKSKRLIDLFYILQSTESYYSNTFFVLKKNTSIEQFFFSSKNETCLSRKLNYKSRNDCNSYFYFSLHHHH